jgi:mRNA interferase RelE/StbE
MRFTCKLPSVAEIVRGHACSGHLAENTPLVLKGPFPRDAREQVEAGLHRYAMTGQGDVKALQGRDGCRLRIGGCGVIFDEDATTILAIYIGRRATTTYKRS